MEISAWALKIKNPEDNSEIDSILITPNQELF